MPIDASDLADIPEVLAFLNKVMAVAKQPIQDGPAKIEQILSLAASLLPDLGRVIDRLRD